MQTASRLLPRTDLALPQFDAAGALTAAIAAEIRALFDATGAVHVTNTGLSGRAALLPLMSSLGFGDDEQFQGGGRTAAAWQAKWAAPGLRHLDYYPPHLYLLPNGEIHYQRDFPARVLFFCETAPLSGGRTFLHAAKKTEAEIAASGQTGRALLQKLADHGVMIEVGFVDRDHPAKAQNYFQSWQERFGSDDPAAALAAAQGMTRQYDSCWWVKDGGHLVLMNRITLPGFVTKDGETYMRFPRIAMDGPALQNGFRRYPFGNGEEMTEDEKSLLKNIWTTIREGHAWRAGDVILMDNIRYAHSREAFTGPREVLIGMAGLRKL